MKQLLKVWVVYFLLVFPLFYFVYKYGTPDLGLKDFYDYYKLYSNWDIAHTDAPFNMRLVSSFFVYAFNKIGLHYDTMTAFDALGMDKQVFFNAVFFNFLCVVTTCVVIYRVAISKFGNTLFAFCCGMLYVLGFGTIFFELMPITDAFSILMFSLIVLWYEKKSYLLLLPMLLLVMQREYIFLAMGLITVLDYWKFREKYQLHVLIMSVLCFAAYYILRKTLFYTPKYDHQASPAYFLESIVQINFPLIPYIKQTLMTMNLFILYLFVIGYKKYKKITVDNFNLLKLILLFLQINVISFAAVFGNNTGRYFYILIPIVIHQLSVEVYPMLAGKERS